MKLLPLKKRNIAILCTGGLGDTLLFVPLIKELKKKQFTITCIFYAPHENDALFDDSLVDEKIIIKNKGHFLLLSITHWKRFANIYINHLGAGKLQYIIAGLVAKRITSTVQTITGKKRQRHSIAYLSDAEENLHLLYSEKNARLPSNNAFYLPRPVLTATASMQQPYFVLQISSGNNTTPFKNWPFTNWLLLIGQLGASCSAVNFVIVGDVYEKEYKKLLQDAVPSNAVILIGETTVQEAFSIVAKCEGYIGQDSGIMHMAVALQKKTLTIFGASNEKLYGYETNDPQQHKILKSAVYCRPCSSWKNANTIRVTDPCQCPDFACLATIDPQFVLREIKMHFNL